MDLAVCKNIQCNKGTHENNLFGNRKILRADDNVIALEYISEHGETMVAYCCCEECAKTVQLYYAEIHHHRLQQTLQATLQSGTLAQLTNHPSEY